MDRSLPPWATQTERGLELTLHQRDLSPGSLPFVAAVLGLGLLVLSTAPLPGALAVLEVSPLYALAAFGVAWVASSRRIALTLGDEALEARGRSLQRGGLEVQLARRPAPLRWLLSPHPTLRLSSTDAPLEIPGIRLSEGNRRWLTEALEAWGRGDPLPPWIDARPDPRTVGTLEPGRQTIELRGQPLSLGRGVLLGGLATLAMLSAYVGPIVLSGDYVGIYVGLLLALFGTPLSAIAYLAWRNRGTTTLQIRQEGLTLIRGASRRTIALADVRSVEAVRRTMHSELVLALADGSTERVPVRGLHVATTLAAAIREAQQAAIESREEAEEAQQARAAQRHAMQQLLERQGLEG